MLETQHNAAGHAHRRLRRTRDLFLVATANLICFEASKSSSGSLKPEKTSAGLRAFQNLKGGTMVNFVCQLDWATGRPGLRSHIVWVFLCAHFGDEVCIEIAGGVKELVLLIVGAPHLVCFITVAVA